MKRDALFIIGVGLFMIVIGQILMAIALVVAR